VEALADWWTRRTRKAQRKFLSPSQRYRLSLHQEHRCPCPFCQGQKFLPPAFEVHHRVPLWAGGTNEFVLGPDGRVVQTNFQALCPTGHRELSSRHAIDFYAALRARRLGF